jgi:hypothetical protein
MAGATGAVTLIQRLGSALNVNIHFYILFLDAVYVCPNDRPPRFQRVKARRESPTLTFAHPPNDTSRGPGPSDSSAYSISMSRFAVIAVGPSKSSLALRTRTLSTGFWLIFARKNKAALPYRHWCHPPEHPLGHYLFSQDANPQPQISKDATEKRVVRTVACYRP